MDETSFLDALKEQGINLQPQQLKQFELYYEILIEENKKVNLTAITEKEEVYLKHFYDSISPLFYTTFEAGSKVCDIGAGAGFPSIPMLIVQPDIHVTIIDSLQKRIRFLERLIERLGLTNVTLVHGRAEETGQNSLYREKYDVVFARAVAKLNVLAEYCLPLCKVGGTFIALKGSHVATELEEAKKAYQALGEASIHEKTFQLPKEASERSIVFATKRKPTSKKYPRKPGTPAKTPII
ncbi:MAG TPA: 16S rRNA (guanine(527)-N(7))-methyltransferase RsmG [Pseudogracilibacillus sp.]|nr:16S rRNA (guanine(527)-N(7))-methyltransferase RsmG [Pseudogracilibacillus sp.]